MKRVNVAGGYLGPNSPIAAPIDFHEKELAAYLARARGPEPSDMKFKLRPRPTGDAARVVFTEYDVPLFAATTPRKPTRPINGSDWSLGTPSSFFGQHGVHDAQADLDGNIWFSVSTSRTRTRASAVSMPRRARRNSSASTACNGMAANGHGAMRDKQGHIWFNMSPGEAGGRGRLIEVDPATQTLQVFTRRRKARKGPTVVAGTVDVDGKGKIWASTFHGASRFDPVTKEFSEYKSPTLQECGRYRKHLRPDRGRRRQRLVGGNES